MVSLHAILCCDYDTLTHVSASCCDPLAVSLMTTGSTSLPVLPPPTPTAFPSTGLPYTIPIALSTTSYFFTHPSVEPNSLPVVPSPTSSTFPPATGLPHTTAPIPIALSITNTFVQHPSVEPTSVLATGTERSAAIVAAVLSVLLVAIIGAVAMVLVAVFGYRRKKSKQVVLHSTAFTNPVYEGKEFQQTWHKVA